MTRESAETPQTPVNTGIAAATSAATSLPHAKGENQTTESGQTPVNTGIAGIAAATSLPHAKRQPKTPQTPVNTGIAAATSLPHAKGETKTPQTPVNTGIAAATSLPQPPYKEYLSEVVQTNPTPGIPLPHAVPTPTSSAHQGDGLVASAK
jgi:hypothetical protein